MPVSRLAQKLATALEEFKIIDAHEHLPPEVERTSKKVDVFTLFSHYTQGDLAVAGVADSQMILNTELPLEYRWKRFAPFWEQIRYGSYARAALLAAKRFYGFEDINETTYQPLSEAMAQANTPGIYQRVLGEACNIHTALTQLAGEAAKTDLGTPLLTPLVWVPGEFETWEAICRPAALAVEKSLGSLEEYLEAARVYFRQVKAAGVVGIKMISNPYQEPKRAEALEAFNRLRRGEESRLPISNPLRDYLIDQLIGIAGENDLTVAVHTGYWGDFRQLHPLHMIPVVSRHPKVRFDIYHLGYPWVRETLNLGKIFPNVWLNLCWTHIISPRMAMAGLDEAIDVIPMNKIVAFGGDYGLPVEKVYGHLVMARENIARVLAARIEEGHFTEKRALEIAHQWFWNNPRELYRLKA